jgi:predicted nucleotidyltransferase
VASWPEFLPSRLLRRLVEGGVDFVVVGGVAVVIQASPRLTNDLDICYSTEQENLDALGAVLIKLKARLRGIDEDVPFVPDGQMLRRTQILTLDTVEGPIDLLVRRQGSLPYPKLRERADVVELDGIEVRVASIRDLLAMKRAAGRPVDLADIESLRIAQRRLGRRRRRR